jgi:hypothetical protein
MKLSNKQGIWFHLAGIAAIVWFLIRVAPRPDRIRYPCQQMGISIAVGYIVFWSLLWSAVFHGLGLWIRRVKYKTAAVAPLLLVVILILFTVSTPVFGINESKGVTMSRWDPVPKQPIGTPQGVNPGRVVWEWNPHATEKQLSGYWWEKQNNDEAILDQMYSSGLQSLAGVDDDFEAWDELFRYFNIEHGNGDIGYQSGEKIAIKINMNNGYIFPYTWESDDIDASPYVVKALLRQLVDVVGVAQEDITVYDASRKLMNWFFNRVYYEEYPATPLVPEFPNVNFVDNDGSVSGRQKVVASNERIYFAYTIGSCEYRTLPTCVTEADYLINMPIIKRHLGPCVTLAGKNLFGSWVEDVLSVHVYHAWGIIMGNPAPQTDLLAHEQMGKKTLLYVGDGTYGCRGGNTDISRFQMYPFNNDWMSSLFFSQDGVAVDSVMYDFLHAEGTGPSEGAQNYLHQAANPPSGMYDPENDGIYLSESLGVHEHWDTSIDIFSSDRYSGPSSNGIDYISADEQYVAPDKPTITGPKNGNPGKEYDYTFVTTDPHEQDVYYWIDWGDQSNSGWIGPYSSGEDVTVGHIWDELGVYIIKAKAKNIFDAESEWETFPVIIPRNKATNNQLLLERFPLLQKLLLLIN